ncbi:hypothetical protein [Microbulbifer agarilyticus]|uniref:hypothetical protein n=1 Tax=Microbulbifer agarilyticus TaxID=260552 RepID=UPI001C95D04F|nr:hypothetical protein [Microbulbifer agarilyticus]MBY6189054.1 hypothetical protein [Microbulbifer agarilyticus]MBY6212122.1 hypothetical protein [Microbulbifer agarilyticus]MCA0893826.1 hypothetical protein [Microbulbifer agarilyticus]
MARKRRRSFVTSVLACLAFIAAAVWSWDLPVEDLLSYLVLMLILLAVIVAVALGFGALLNWLRNRNSKNRHHDDR